MGFEIGSVVRFREGTPQFAKNKDITYVVVPSPSGNAASVDRTHDGEERLYVWLEREGDQTLAPSRRRGRTGYIDALEAV